MHCPGTKDGGSMHHLLVALLPLPPCQLACLTSRKKKREAALAHLQYEQECCKHAALGERQQQQAAAVWAKVLANKADKRCCHEAATLAEMALAKEQHCQDALPPLAALSDYIDTLLATLNSLAAESRQRMTTLDSPAAVLADSVMLAKMELAKEQTCHAAVSVLWCQRGGLPPISIVARS